MSDILTQPLIDAKLSDLDFNLAEQAHHNISMNPEARARRCQSEYMAEMEHIETTFAPFATTPEITEMLRMALEEYRLGYLKHQRAILSARSRTASSMITGPSCFPAERNLKRLDTEQRRIEDFTKWRENAYSRLHDRFNPQEPNAISSDREDAVDALRSKLERVQKFQAQMLAANKIVRSKDDDETKVKRMVEEVRLAEAIARQALKPDVMGRTGFPEYATKNNGAEIRRLQQRIEDVQAQQSRPRREVDFINCGGGYIVDNPDNNRVQIIFADKPGPDVRDKLKANGFHWSPTEGAWQRQRTEAGIYAAEMLMGVKF